MQHNVLHILFTIRWEAKLSTNHLCFRLSPWIVTYRTPHFIWANLHSALTAVGSPNQPQLSLSTVFCITCVTCNGCIHDLYRFGGLLPEHLTPASLVCSQNVVECKHCSKSFSVPLHRNALVEPTPIPWPKNALLKAKGSVRDADFNFDLHTFDIYWTLTIRGMSKLITYHTGIRQAP